MKLALVFLVAIGATVAVTATASHEQGYSPTKLYPRGGVAGGDAYVLPMGDIQGVRNIQGGRHTGHKADRNLDIGAGSTEHPGVVAVNFDVGRALVIFDGRKRKIASFSRRGIVFYHHPVIRRR